MIRARQPWLTKPARVSLAEFSKSLTSIETQIQPDCDSDTTETVSLESAGRKLFAAEVVAAMSNPALTDGEEVLEAPGGNSQQH